MKLVFFEEREKDVFCLMEEERGGRFLFNQKITPLLEKKPCAVPLPVVLHTFPTFISETSFPEKKEQQQGEGGFIFFRAKWIVGGCEKVVLLVPFVPMVGDDAPEINSHSHTPRKKENIL